MDPVNLIIASLDVKGGFPNTPWLLLEAVWKRLGLCFYNFASGYIRTRKYTVRTGAGLTLVLLVPRGHRPNMCVACSGSHGGPVVGLGGHVVFRYAPFCS